MPKNRGTWTVCRFKGGFVKKRGLRRGFDTPMHTVDGERNA